MLIKGKLILSAFREREKPNLVAFLSTLCFISITFITSVLDNLIYGNAQYKDILEKNFQAHEVMKTTGLQRLNEQFYKYISWSVADWDDIWGVENPGQTPFSEYFVKSASELLRTDISEIFDVTETNACNDEFIKERLILDGNSRRIFERISFHTALPEYTVRSPNELNRQECTVLENFANKFALPTEGKLVPWDASTFEANNKRLLARWFGNDKDIQDNLKIQRVYFANQRQLESGTGYQLFVYPSANSLEFPASEKVIKDDTTEFTFVNRPWWVVHNSSTEIKLAKLFDRFKRSNLTCFMTRPYEDVGSPPELQVNRDTFVTRTVSCSVEAPDVGERVVFAIDVVWRKDKTPKATEEFLSGLSILPAIKREIDQIFSESSLSGSLDRAEKSEQTSQDLKQEDVNNANIPNEKASYDWLQPRLNTGALVGATFAIFLIWVGLSREYMGLFVRLNRIDAGSFERELKFSSKNINQVESESNFSIGLKKIFSAIFRLKKIKMGSGVATFDYKKTILDKNCPSRVEVWEIGVSSYSFYRWFGLAFSLNIKPLAGEYFAVAYNPFDRAQFWRLSGGPVRKMLQKIKRAEVQTTLRCTLLHIEKTMLNNEQVIEFMIPHHEGTSHVINTDAKGKFYVEDPGQDLLSSCPDVLKNDDSFSKIFDNGANVVVGRFYFSDGGRLKSRLFEQSNLKMDALLNIRYIQYLLDRAVTEVEKTKASLNIKNWVYEGRNVRRVIFANTESELTNLISNESELFEKIALQESENLKFISLESLSDPPNMRGLTDFGLFYDESRSTNVLLRIKSLVDSRLVDEEWDRYSNFSKPMGYEFSGDGSWRKDDTEFARTLFNFLYNHESAKSLKALTDRLGK